MSSQSNQSTVTFRHPIIFKDFEEPYPAGTYRLVFDSEESFGLSFTAYRQTAIRLHLPALAVSELPTQVVRISQAELDAMIARDAAAQ